MLLDFRAPIRVGMDTEYAPPCGPVAIVALPDGQNNRDGRAHQVRCFGKLTSRDAGSGKLLASGEAVLTDQKPPGDRFPLSVIGHTVWLYHR